MCLFPRTCRFNYLVLATSNNMEESLFDKMGTLIFPFLNVLFLVIVSIPLPPPFFLSIFSVLFCMFGLFEILARVSIWPLFLAAYAYGWSGTYSLPRFSFRIICIKFCWLVSDEVLSSSVDRYWNIFSYCQKCWRLVCPVFFPPVYFSWH